MDAEIDARKDDPVATGQALARLDAILGDMRYLRDRLARTTASAMDRLRIKQLTVEGLATWEATASYKRTGWRHRDLLIKALDTTKLTMLDENTGELLASEATADIILEWLTPSWKLTGLRALGVKPDDYCTVDTDEEGNAVRTPGVRFYSNREKES
jgi:hypothetical protein